MQYAYFVPRNTTKLTTRGGTSPDGVEMTLIRERKSTHRLGTRLPKTSLTIIRAVGRKFKPVRPNARSKGVVWETPRSSMSNTPP